MVSNSRSKSFSLLQLYTVRKVLADPIAKDALRDVKFSQIEGNGRTFSHIKLINSVIT